MAEQTKLDRATISKLIAPYRIVNGENFRLKDHDPETPALMLRRKRRTRGSSFVKASSCWTNTRRKYSRNIPGRC
jgi:hypothetical protein